MLQGRFALLLLASSLVAFTQPASAGIRGFVHDENKQPIAGAWLEIRRIERGAVAPSDFTGPPAQSLRSQADGSWSFSDLEEGTWVLTAVACSSPRTDEELGALAAPRADGRAPPGVAIARLFRFIPPQTTSQKAFVDIGLSLGPAAAHPLYGRLTGTFDPTRFGYVIRLVPNDRTPSPKSSTARSTTTSTPKGPFPAYFQAPDGEGRFDFGTYEPSDSDSIKVDRISLSGSEKDEWSTEFSSEIAQLGARTDGIEINLGGQRTVAPGGPRTITLSALTSDGKAVAVPQGEAVAFTIWDDQGADAHLLVNMPSVAQLFAEGTYLVQASMGSLASPVTVIKVDAACTLETVPLVVMPCDGYTLHFVDAKGAPIPMRGVKLGPADSGIPRPCRITFEAGESGDVELDQIPPGAYEVEAFNLDRTSFTQKLSLSPGGGSIVVTRS